MILKRTDLPLYQDSHSRFLPWLVAFMIFLAVFGLASIIVLKEVANRWDRGVSGTISVQIPAAAEPSDDEKRLGKILKGISKTDKIDSYEVVTKEKIKVLLEPWLGDLDNVRELPLPQLIDVKFKTASKKNFEEFSENLTTLVEDVIIDDHQVWLTRLLKLIQTLEAIAWIVLILIIIATIGTVVFTTQTGLAIHREAIEVLHLIGAPDKYIARQFALRAFGLGLKGGIVGLIIGVPLLLGLIYFAKKMEEFFFSTIKLEIFHWFLLGTLPVLVGLIAMLTAKVTVMRTLARML